MAAFRMVTLGDSVSWGQGLLDAHKYRTLVAQTLGARFTVSADNCSHSGATIGVGAGHNGAADGEVPDSYPTILDQCGNYANAPGDVDLVLVNGGINDVNVRTILDPLTSVNHLTDLTRKHCHDDMVTLLGDMCRKFSKATAKIAVTGYFPILSRQSDPKLIPDLLNVHCIRPPDFLADLPITDKIIELCLTFWNVSNASLAQAVQDANRGSGGGRVVFVPLPYGEQNSVFAPQAWLWGIHLDPTLSPEDEVIAPRHQSCDVFYRAHPLDVLARETCYRASAGHPNVVGAGKIAEAILAAIRL